MEYDLGRPIALVRVAVGIGSWLAPKGILAVTRLDPAAPQSPHLLRLFAARETALGVATLLASDRRELLLELGLVVDCLDTAAGLLALRSGPKGKGIGLLTAVAAGGVLMSTAALVQARRKRGVARVDGGREGTPAGRSRNVPTIALLTLRTRQVVARRWPTEGKVCRTR